MPVLTPVQLRKLTLPASKAESAKSADARSLVVQLHAHFLHHNHLCLLFEPLGVNLLQLLQQNQCTGLSCSLIRYFSKQLLQVLSLLREMGICHCDLKPENILLQNLHSPAIKLIDFGSACYAERPMHMYIQSRFYRSPEVLLGMRYSTQIDMWSMGAIVGELFLGLPLFPGETEYNQLARIVKMCGVPPDAMLSAAPNATKFFERVAPLPPAAPEGAATPSDGVGGGARASSADGSPRTHRWTLKNEEQFCLENGGAPCRNKQYFKYEKLSELIAHHPPVKGAKPPTDSEIAADRERRSALLHFCEGLLQLHPSRRWTPLQSIRHPFITGEPFSGSFTPPARESPMRDIPAMQPRAAAAPKPAAATGGSASCTLTPSPVSHSPASSSDGGSCPPTSGAAAAAAAMVGPAAVAGSASAVPAATGKSSPANGSEGGAGGVRSRSSSSAAHSPQVMQLSPPPPPMMAAKMPISVVCSGADDSASGGGDGAGGSSGGGSAHGSSANGAANDASNSGSFRARASRGGGGYMQHSSASWPGTSPASVDPAQHRQHQQQPAAAQPATAVVLSDGSLIYHSGFASSPPPQYSASPPAFGGVPGIHLPGGVAHPGFYSTSPPAPGFYASPPLALSPPSIQMLSIAMGGSQPAVGTSPPMGYGGMQPMGTAQPIAVPTQMGQMLFAPQYVAADGSSYAPAHTAYGVQMAVSPPVRDHFAYGGGDMGGYMPQQDDGSGGGMQQVVYDPNGAGAGNGASAQGYYAADGQFYYNPAVQQQPQGYYPAPGGGGHPGGGHHVPQMTLRVNTGHGDGQQQQKYGGGGGNTATTKAAAAAATAGAAQSALAVGDRARGVANCHTAAAAVAARPASAATSAWITLGPTRVRMLRQSRAPPHRQRRSRDSVGGAGAAVAVARRSAAQTRGRKSRRASLRS